MTMSGGSGEAHLFNGLCGRFERTEYTSALAPTDLCPTFSCVNYLSNCKQYA
ncbi:MAG: hypothetical protein ACI9CP_000166 [Cryomorphaceae bacterium]|jgi:hypothetical protein